MRAEKQMLVEEVKNRIDTSPYVLVADYTGMNMPQFNELRSRLRSVQARFTVVKNTMLRNALRDRGWPDLEAILNGPTAIISGNQDVCAAAKIAKNFQAEFTKGTFKGGVLDGAALSAEECQALADLPPREILLAQLLGVLSAPATKLVRLINTPGQQLAAVIRAHVDKEQPSA